MKVRLYSSSDPLGYMHLGKNENSEEGLRDIYDCRVEVDNELMNVVIFLHSFDDGLYIYGVPPFGDMYSWACFSIRQCIGNPKIGKVLVKPHPSLEYGEGPNRTLLAKMASEFSGFDKCIFIQPRSSLVALSRVKHIVGITSHGSVAEDFSYLGRLVIGSVYSPWQDNFRFLRTWKTIADYAHMLDRLSSRSRSHLDWAEWLELLNYVNTFRINGTSDAKKLYSTRFGKAVTGCECTGMSDAEFFPIANSHLAAKDDWLEITRSLSIVLVNRTA
jgi:hypothetical protein